MGSEWAETSLNEVADFRNGAGVKQVHFAENGTPLARVSDFTSDSIDISDTKLVESNHAKSWESHFIKEDDVIVATVGSWPPNWSSVVGKVVRAPRDAVGAIQNQNTCCVQPDTRKLDNRFLFYRLKQEDFAWHAANNAGGSANQARLPVKKLGTFSFRLPPLPEQKAIAHILGTLDDKIELNRRMNATLEGMAQALFKSWFVDFDPVIDNALAAGNPIPDELAPRAEVRKKALASSGEPGRTNGTTKQGLADHPTLSDPKSFPSAFEYSDELGWIPEGWNVKRADEAADISIGKTPPRKEAHWFSQRSSGNITWISIKDLGGCGAFIGDSSEYLTPESVDQFNVKVIPKGSVLLSFKLTVGRVSIAEAIAHFVAPKFGLTKEFLYSYLKDFDFSSLGSTSSIVTAVNSKIIKAMPVLVPSKEALNHFEGSVGSWFRSIRVNTMATKTLTKLRDTLLPKLIPGELCLPEAEQHTKEPSP